MKIHQLKEGRQYKETDILMPIYEIKNGLLMEVSMLFAKSTQSEVSYNNAIRMEFTEIFSATKDEMALLKILVKKWKYIARNVDGELFVYTGEIAKDSDGDWMCVHSRDIWIRIDVLFVLGLEFEWINNEEPVCIADVIAKYGGGDECQ